LQGPVSCKHYYWLYRSTADCWTHFTGTYCDELSLPVCF